MSRERTRHAPELSRRLFLTAMGSTLVKAAASRGGQLAEGDTPAPKRGGVLRFATRGDATGLDPHRNLIYPVSQSLAATRQGLLDLNLHSEPVPGIAAEWEAAKDLKTYTFKLRKGANCVKGCCFTTAGKSMRPRCGGTSSAFRVREDRISSRVHP